MAKAVRKTARKTAPAKHKPRHGHGMLYVGGVPGNKGGSGRPPALIRSLARNVCEPALAELGRRVKRARDRKKLDVKDVARIVQVTGQLGLGDQAPSEEFLMGAAEAFQWAARRAVMEVLAPTPEQEAAFTRTLGQRLIEIVQTARQRRAIAERTA